MTYGARQELEKSKIVCVKVVDETLLDGDARRREETGDESS